jgi:hypothetical protein
MPSIKNDFKKLLISTGLIYSQVYSKKIPPFVNRYLDKVVRLGNYERIPFEKYKFPEIKSSKFLASPRVLPIALCSGSFPNEINSKTFFQEYE